MSVQDAIKRTQTTLGGLNLGEGHPLPDMLQVAVPFRVLELKMIPADRRFPIIQTWATEAGEVLERTGEAILYRTKEGASAEAFNAVAKAIAALSFMPGGITLFGHHWESNS